MSDGGSGLPMATEPASTTVSGFRARYVELRIPDDVDPARCSGGRYATWRNADGVERHHSPGDVSRLWIVEVGPAPDVAENQGPPTSTPPLVIDAFRAESPRRRL